MHACPAVSRQRALATAGMALLAVLLFQVPLSHAGTVWVPGGSEGVSNIAVRSFQERKFDRVVRQAYDFSCGSAALATLLTFHYEDPIDEQTAFRYMFERGDQKKIAQVGFSLLDMKNYLENSGYEADGYQAPLETLTDAGVPAIALINYRGYRHFVVIKGVTKDEVLLGDPSLGLRQLPLADFRKSWENGILFIIRNKPAVGQRNFNANADWGRVLRAPLWSAVDRDALEAVTVVLNRFGSF
jgi:hypothetical protein